jgi:hypothetical protein
MGFVRALGDERTLVLINYGLEGRQVPLDALVTNGAPGLLWASEPHMNGAQPAQAAARARLTSLHMLAPQSVQVWDLGRKP